MPLAPVQEPMQSCNSDVVERIDGIPENFESHHRFLGNRHIRSARRDHHNRALSANTFILSNNNGSSGCVKFRFRHDFPNTSVLFDGRSRYKNIVLMLRHGSDDPCDLLGRFSCAEYGLRKPLPKTPVVIDVGKTEVFKWQIAKPVEGTFVG